MAGGNSEKGLVNFFSFATKHSDVDKNKDTLECLNKWLKLLFDKKLLNLNKRPLNKYLTFRGKCFTFLSSTQFCSHTYNNIKEL